MALPVAAIRLFLSPQSCLGCQIRANSTDAGSPCWPRALADAFALLLPAHKGVVSRVSAHFARAILLSANRVIVDDKRMMQLR